MFYNFILIGFILALIVISIFWAFNAVRRIEIEKNFCAGALTSIAKLWRRANYIPEDAKERESLYLYRDFLRKFDESECKYPIAVKNNGVRAMTRKEYDNVSGVKTQGNFSVLILSATILIALIALIVNVINHTFMIGLGLALIMPVVQVLLAMFLQRFNKEKNNYRDAIFLALKENSINFLSITKPFILVDAYPDKFGKKTKPLFNAKGELTEEQIAEIRDYIVAQKQAENKVELRSVNNNAEIEQMNHPVELEPEIVEPVAEVSTNEEPTQEEAEPVVESTEVETETEIEEAPLTDEEREQLINNLVEDMILGDIRRAIKEQDDAKREAEKLADAEFETEANEAAKEVETNPKPTTNELEQTEITEPAEDDFSLEAIGQALDAEIEKRNKKR